MTVKLEDAAAEALDGQNPKIGKDGIKLADNVGAAARDVGIVVDAAAALLRE